MKLNRNELESHLYKSIKQKAVKSEHWKHLHPETGKILLEILEEVGVLPYKDEIIILCNDK